MYDHHIWAYWAALGYKRENHPDWITITELLKRRADLWARKAG